MAAYLNAFRRASLVFVIAASSPVSAATPPDYNSLAVVRQIKDASGKVIAETTRTGRLNQSINVAIPNLSAWVAGETSRALSVFTLYLDGRQIKGVTAAPLSLKNDHLRFELKHTPDPENKAAWTALLSEPTKDGRPLSISVGLENQLPLPSTATFILDPFPRGWLAGWIVFMIGVLILFFYGAVDSDLIRNGGDDPVQDPPPASDLPALSAAFPLLRRRKKKIRRQYSLGRSQMAFWFLIVLGAFTFIWMVTGDHDTITPTVLSLIGISSGTGLAAAIVDKSTAGAGADQRRDLNLQLADLTAQQAKLETDLTAAAGTAAASQVRQTLDQLKARIAQTNDQIAALPAASPPASQGWWTDVLEDANGLTLHRFQILLWTVVLGIIFVRTVYDSLAMPDFSATLLGLMGISSGTYLGFKFPETKP